MPTRAERWQAFVDETLRRCAADGELFERGLSPGPTCPPHYGAAGIAYFLYRVGRLRDDRRLLDAAALWSGRAQADVQRPEAFSLGGEPSERLAPPSTHFSATGIHWVEALVQGALRNAQAVETAVERFAGSARPVRSDELDLSLGWSGVELAAALLLERLELPERAAALSKETGQAARDRVLPLFGDPIQRRAGTGMAHGWAGLLFSSLRWSEATGEAVPVAVRERLDELAALAVPAGRGLVWPVQLGAEEYWEGFCAGSAGFVHLWVTAARALAEPDYLELAERAAWDSWNCRHRQLADLCCGLAGQAYALLRLATVADGLWSRRAREVADRAVKTAPQLPTARHSLYRGDPGIALLLTELDDAPRAAMPLVDPA